MQHLHGRGVQVEVSNWTAKGFLVHMDAVVGGQAPAGDLSLTVDAVRGVCQLVVIHCKKVARERVVAPKDIISAHTRLKDCVAG